MNPLFGFIKNIINNRENFIAFSFNYRDDILKRRPILFNKIGNENGNTPTNSSKTMYQDIDFLSRLIYKYKCFLEMFR
jgi:hypothetical protein